MIQINELRIGNLIERNGIIATIEIINNELDEIYFLGKDFYHSDFCCNLTPIPLTEEWLNKFTYNFKDLGFPDLTVGYGMTSGIVHFYIGNYAKRIDYIHQLQNLYFALTGTELTVA